MAYSPAWESICIGRLDLPEDDHPDTYTGKVAAWHQNNTPWDDVQLYAETLAGQPVPLCTLDCAVLLYQMLNDVDAEAVSVADIPYGCCDFADVTKAYNEALELLSRTRCKGGLGDDIQTFLRAYKED